MLFQKSPALVKALQALDVAGSGLKSTDWESHAQAVPNAVEALSRFYLHIDAETGEFGDLGVSGSYQPIYTDPKRKVFGLYPAAMAPLVRLLREQTTALDAFEGKVPESSALAIKRWKQRLQHYEAEVAKAMAIDPYAPSEVLWKQVTAPLLLGRYPVSFQAMGIINPAARSKPDVTTIATETFVVAYNDELVSDFAAWAVDWSTKVQAWFDTMSSAVVRIVDGAKDKAKTAIAWVLGGIVLVVVAILIVRWSRQRTAGLAAASTRPQLEEAEAS